MRKPVLFGVVFVVAAIFFAAACGDDESGDELSADDSGAIESDSSFAGDGEAVAPQPAIDAIEEEEAADADAARIGEQAAPGAAESPAGEPSTENSGIGSLDRKIIESATIELEVDDVLRSFSTATRIAVESGGFVASSNVFSEDDERFATLTIRVPATAYNEALERLRGLGEVVTEGSNASDVTEEFTDLESRLRNLEAIESQYVQLLSRATTIEEILVVQDRLNVTRAEIEQVRGRINVLNDLAELASIEVFLSRPAVAPGGDAGEGWQLFAPAEAALENSYDALRHVASGAIAAGVYGLWVLPLAALGLFVARLLSRRDTSQAS